MKWYGILTFLVIIAALAGIVYLGMNTDKIGVNFGEPSFISNQIASTTSVFGYEIDSACDLAYFIRTHPHYNSYDKPNFDLSEIPVNDPKDIKKLQDLVYLQYEKWEVESGYYDKEIALIKRGFVYNLQTEYAIKHHDINPKFYSIVDKGIHYMSSQTYDQDKAEFTMFAFMINPNLYGEDNACERKYLEEFGNDTYDAIMSYNRNNEQQSDIVWNEIQLRVYD